MLKNSIRVKGLGIFTILIVLLLSGCGSSGGDGVPTYVLTVTVHDQGTGTVTSSPAGIDCGADCTESYTQNTVVTLTATPASGYVFVGWSDACTGTGNCSVTMETAKSVTATFTYRVDCSASDTYAPATSPLITLPSTGAATTSVIVMHGKTGSPLSPHLPPLYTDLSNAGYDVIAPYMPWSGLVWDGSMCEAMNYIDSLAAQEAAKGRNVVVAGHSMGGAHALIYGVTTPSNEVKAIVTMAPGHFPHILPEMQTDTAPSIALAESMVASGNGDIQATFVIRLSGATTQITASANDYLSYHALYQYPDVNDVIPAIELPVLWLSGDTDTLTTYIDMAGLASRLTNPDSDYQVVSGDHKTMVSSSGAPIDTWLKSLGI